MAKRVPAPASGAVEGKKKYTAGDIRAALKRFFPHPDFGIVFEVAQGTGFNANRHIDAVAMDTWPSRGLRLKAIEIKVSYADWKRELADPSKAEEIARFCDEMWIAAPKNVVPIVELPPAWGLYELWPNDPRPLVCVKAAQKTKAEPCSREFLAAIFRGAGRKVDGETLDAMLDARLAEVRANYADDLKREAERIAGARSKDAENWQALIQSLGVVDDAEDWRSRLFSDDVRAVQAIVKALRKSGVMDNFHGLAGLHASVRELHKRLDEAMAIFELEPLK